MREKLYFIRMTFPTTPEWTELPTAYGSSEEAKAVIEQMRKNNCPDGIFAIDRYDFNYTEAVPGKKVSRITLTGNKMVEIPIEPKQGEKPEKKALPKHTLLGDILSGKVELDGDRDVENTLTDEVFPCICDMVRATEEGLTHYAHVMAMPVRIGADYLTITCETEEDVEELRNFCYAQAGYIDSDLYDRYFV